MKMAVQHTGKDIAQFDAILEEIQQEVYQPIETIKLSSSSNYVANCLTHHSPLSLYCELDRKLLCSSCMYEEETHRKHTVMPISKAHQYIKQDIVSYQNRIESILKQSDNLNKRIHEDMMEGDNYYRDCEKKLRAFYISLKESISRKEREQFEVLEAAKKRNKAELSYFCRNLLNLNKEIRQQIKEQSQKKDRNANAEKQIVLNSCKFFQICKIYPYVSTRLPDLTSNFKFEKIIDFQQLFNLQNLVETHLKIGGKQVPIIQEKRKESFQSLTNAKAAQIKAKESKFNTENRKQRKQISTSPFKSKTPPKKTPVKRSVRFVLD